MKSLQQVLSDVIVPGLALLPAKMDTPAARTLMLAIHLQEDPGQSPVQYGGGPAHGWWQFERGGAAKGILQHHATQDLAAQLCKDRGINPTAAELWQALATDQVLAAACARLLLYTDPATLPAPAAASQDAAWAYYLRNWRPGKPGPARWPANWRSAVAAVSAAAVP